MLHSLPPSIAIISNQIELHYGKSVEKISTCSGSYWRYTVRIKTPIPMAGHEPKDKPFVRQKSRIFFLLDLLIGSVIWMETSAGTDLNPYPQLLSIVLCKLFSRRLLLLFVLRMEFLVRRFFQLFSLSFFSCIHTLFLIICAQSFFKTSFPQLFSISTAVRLFLSIHKSSFLTFGVLVAFT